MNALHDILYDEIVEICHDKEYVYPLFLRVFAELTGQIYGEGGVRCAGQVQANGIKSDDRVVFQWRLLRRVSYLGHNELNLCTVVYDRYTDEKRAQREHVFDISTGECIQSQNIKEE